MENIVNNLRMANPAQLELEVTPANTSFKNYPLWLSWSRFFRQCGILVAVASLGVLSYLLISHFGFQSVFVDGQSMNPTLANSEHYWLNRMAYVKSEPQFKDIVALKDPQDNILVVKRVIAGPGQSVYLHQGKVYLDGKLLKEPYLPAGTLTFAYEKSEDEFICVGKNEYFVLGDNRNNSTDSRVFGTVPRRNILGKVVE